MDDYISSQIAVYKNSSRIVECINKLQRAPLKHYAHLHASRDTDIEGKDRRISCIGLNVIDYTTHGSNGKPLLASANILPSEADYLLKRSLDKMKSFTFERIKQYENPIAGGTISGTNLLIQRVPVDKDGNKMRYPWIISVTNFHPDKTNVTVKAKLSDFDFYNLMYCVSRFIQIWEIAMTPSLVRKAIEKVRFAIIERIKRNEQAGENIA